MIQEALISMALKDYFLNYLLSVYLVGGGQKQFFPPSG